MFVSFWLYVCVVQKDFEKLFDAINRARGQGLLKPLPSLLSSHFGVSPDTVEADDTEVQFDKVDRKKIVAWQH